MKAVISLLMCPPGPLYNKCHKLSCIMFCSWEDYHLIPLPGSLDTCLLISVTVLFAIPLTGDLGFWKSSLLFQYELTLGTCELASCDYVTGHSLKVLL